MSPRATKSLSAQLFRPTTSVSGDEPPTVFRGQNFMLRGPQGNQYFEVHPGDKDLGENFDLTSIGAAITGTISTTAGGPTVAGSGTVFQSQLHVGQMILTTTGEVFVVKEVVSDTSFTAYNNALATDSGLTAYRMPQMFDIDRKRGVQFTGNAIAFRLGHLVSVGSGPLFINGAQLNAPLTATKKPQTAIYRPSTNDYVIRPLGYAGVPPKPTINVVAGGTKSMTADQLHSFLFSYWSGTPEGTNGFGLACDVIKLDGASAPIKMIANGQFEVDFTASLAGLPTNAKGFVIWKSQEGKAQQSITGGTVTTISPNETLYNNGPWLRAKKVLISDLLMGNLYRFETLDQELFEEYDGDDFGPTEAEYVTKQEDRPMLISCFGKATTTSPTGAAPGPLVSLSKFANPDGFPPEWVAGGQYNILGFIEGVGRTFLMTPSSLDFVTSTGLLGQSASGGLDAELPLIWRSYWKSGAANRYSIILDDDTLYGRSGGKFIRSIGNGDENVRKYDFGAVVEDVTRDWIDGFSFAARNPKEGQVCFIHSAARKNGSGYWESEIWPFSVWADAWLPKVVLTSTTRDMIVCGVATVDERLEYLCGGRVSGGTYQVKTYRFADGLGSGTIPWYVVWQPSNDGEEMLSKRIHGIIPTGRLTSPVLQVHGTRRDGNFSFTNIENGNGADTSAYFSGNISLASSTGIKSYIEAQMRISGLTDYAVRLSGAWDAANANRDRLEEVVVEVSTHGRAR